MITLVAYYSVYGNTKQIAEAMASVFEKKGTVRLVTIDKITEADFNQVDLVVMGAPTIGANIPEAARTALAKLPQQIMPATNIAAFDTSIKWWPKRFTAARRLAKKLGNLGGKMILPPMNYYVKGTEGPLLAGEIERAKAWAETILGQIKA